VPTGTPADVVQKVNAVVNGYLQSDKGKQQIVKLDLLASGGTPEDANAFIAGEVAKWAPVIQSANITNSP
jgi:tripartite-type tricarboxylate transporter receptor subunit TctC